MNALRILCVNPACQKVLRLRASQAGQRIVCPACRAEMMAPDLPPGFASDNDEPPALSRWRSVLSILGFLFLFVLIAAGAAAFEVFLAAQAVPINQGETARWLTSTTWQVAAIRTGQEDLTIQMPPWCARGAVWTFRVNGELQTGPISEERRRYDHDPRQGFRTWSWSLSESELTLQDGARKNVFTVEEAEKGRLLLASTVSEEPTLVLETCPPVLEFPELRIVFYSGVIAPLLVSMLLTWLIARLWVHSGWLRFTLTWPLMALIGLALGGLAGYFLDVLDDFSHAATPYMMQLGFAQGGLGIVLGFWLGILSWLRT